MANVMCTKEKKQTEAFLSGILPQIDQHYAHTLSRP